MEVRGMFSDLQPIVPAVIIQKLFPDQAEVPHNVTDAIARPVGRKPHPPVGVLDVHDVTEHVDVERV